MKSITAYGQQLVRAILIFTLVGISTLSVGQRTAAAARITIRYLCLPHPNSPGASHPTVEDIRAFVRLHQGVLQNTADELLLDLEFGRWVVGQKQILNDAETFQKTHPGDNVQVRFLHPAEWRDQIDAEYKHVPANTVLVVQIGDSWEKYFVSEGMLANFGSDRQPVYARRYFYDVRFIWYWKNLVRPEDLANGNSLLRAVTRLRATNVVPLAISRSRDFDLFWNMYLWLNAAGGKLVDQNPRLGVLPWTEAVVANDSGQLAVKYLCDLASAGGLALPESSNIQVTEDFLNGNYAMCVMEPWVAFRARQQFGSHWSDKIGAALIPDLTGTAIRKTFIGGYMLGILNPHQNRPLKHDTDDPGVRDAAAWIDYLTNQADPNGHLKSLQFIPASDAVWRASNLKPFFDQAMGGEDASLPSRLETLRRSWSPPVLPEGPTSLETEEVLSRIAALWHGLERIHSDDPFDTQRDQEHRVKLVQEALMRTQDAMNVNLSPGYYRRQLWWIVMVLALSSALLAYTIWHQIREWKWRIALKRRKAEIVRMQVGLSEALGSAAKDTSPPADAPGWNEARFEENLAKLRQLIRDGKVSLVE